MPQYELVFIDSRNRRSKRTVTARNFDEAFDIGDRLAQRFNRSPAGRKNKATLRTAARVQSTPKPKRTTKKSADGGIVGTIGRNLDIIPHLF
ncbi:hypothetical protein LCGC14_1595250 [marine sediment metagenome]|uniref:Uncharacterized protein n=1 Tax=marine sediment metagenome TaxID=412755 RepID=A0A0F9ID51_9ZZZZ